MTTALSQPSLFDTLRTVWLPTGSPERHGPCWLYVDALLELISRLTVEHKIRIGRVYRDNATWNDARQAVKKYADRATFPNSENVRDIKNPMSPWQRVSTDMEDVLSRTHTLAGDLASNPYEQAGEQVLVDLAQALLVWDSCRPRICKALFAYLGRCAFTDPQLIGEHAPTIVGLWMLGPYFHGWRELAVGLIGGKDLEAGRARVHEIEALEEHYRRRKAGRDTEADQP